MSNQNALAKLASALTTSRQLLVSGVGSAAAAANTFSAGVGRAAADVGVATGKFIAALPGRLLPKRSHLQAGADGAATAGKPVGPEAEVSLGGRIVKASSLGMLALGTVVVLVNHLDANQVAKAPGRTHEIREVQALADKNGVVIASPDFALRARRAEADAEAAGLPFGAAEQRLVMRQYASENAGTFVSLSMGVWDFVDRTVNSEAGQRLWGYRDVGSPLDSLSHAATMTGMPLVQRPVWYDGAPPDQALCIIRLGRTPGELKDLVVGHEEDGPLLSRRSSNLVPHSFFKKTCFLNVGDRATLPSILFKQAFGIRDPRVVAGYGQDAEAIWVWRDMRQSMWALNRSEIPGEGVIGKISALVGGVDPLAKLENDLYTEAVAAVMTADKAEGKAWRDAVLRGASLASVLYPEFPAMGPPLRDAFNIHDAEAKRREKGEDMSFADAKVMGNRAVERTLERVAARNGARDSLLAGLEAKGRRLRPFDLPSVATTLEWAAREPGMPADARALAAEVAADVRAMLAAGYSFEKAKAEGLSDLRLVAKSALGWADGDKGLAKATVLDATNRYSYHLIQAAWDAGDPKFKQQAIDFHNALLRSATDRMSCRDLPAHAGNTLLAGMKRCTAPGVGPDSYNATIFRTPRSAEVEAQIGKVLDAKQPKL